MSGFKKVLQKNLDKDCIAGAIQADLPGGPDGPVVQMINGAITGWIPALADDLSTTSQFGYGGNFGYDTDQYPVVPTILEDFPNPACGTGSNETSQIGTLVIDPMLPPGSADVFDLAVIPKDISAGGGSVILFCPTTGQYTAPQGSYGGVVGQVRTIAGLDASSLNCPIEDVLVGFLAFGANGNTIYEGNCDEICADVGTIVAITPSECDPARECFKDIFGCYPEEMSELPDGLSADDVTNLIANYVSNNPSGLSEDEVIALIGPHLELCPVQAVVATGLTYINPQLHRRGYRGEDTDASRCDHVHECRRINPTPLEPAITYAGVGTLEQNIILDRWSDDKWVEYSWRALVGQDAGTGWGYLVVPNLAGFQRPIITVEGTYRFQSTAVQEDGSANTNNQSTEGAGPRGPFMGQEAHHWSSTQRIYMGYFRRDNPHRTYVDYRAKYVCL